MTFAQVARAVLDAALAADAPVPLTLRPHRVDVVVRDHRVVVEVMRGVLRVVRVGSPVGDGPATRDQRVALDDVDEAVVVNLVSQILRTLMA